MNKSNFLEMTAMYQKACESLDEKEERLQKEIICKKIVSGISCFAELAIKCTLAGIEQNDKVLLSLFPRYETDGVWLIACEDGIHFINEKGELVELDEIHGNINISGSNVKTLNGSPKKVHGSFKCESCKNLESLEGGPEYVFLDFSCSDCELLENLVGAPKTVGMDFYCMSESNMVSLEGIPNEIGGGLMCSICKNLRNLDALKNLKMTRTHERRIVCSFCDNLTSIDGSFQCGVNTIVATRCPSIKIIDFPKNIKIIL